MNDKQFHTAIHWFAAHMYLLVAIILGVADEHAAMWVWLVIAIISVFRAGWHGLLLGPGKDKPRRSAT